MPLCVEIKPKLIGLVVDRVLTCSSIDKDLAASASDVGQDSRVLVIVDQYKGRIESITDWHTDSLANMPGLDELIEFPVGATLMPGFIDCHVHLTIATDDYQLDHLRMSSADKTLRALRFAQGLLQAGFTTVRSAGDADKFYPSFAVARSINKGDFIGPRIVGAGHYISVTGGGGDINFMAPESCHCCPSDGLIADGKEAMIKAVRDEIKFGSDWIKILVTGAFMAASSSPKDSPENTHFSMEELSAVVEEAARRRVPVMAHAHGAEGIRMAAEAGCRSIEHASFIDQAGIEACLRKGVYIVPTFLVGAYYEEEGSKTGAQDRMIDIIKETDARYRECIQAASRAGVKVALGSDFVGWDPSITAKEFEYLVSRGGLTPVQAIYAGTSTAADLLGIETLGRILPGYTADLVVVEGNPLNDITLLRTGLRFVMKGGKVVRNDIKM